jgi:hypothetical protein
MKKESSKKSSALSRRELLGAAAAVAAFTYIPKKVLADPPSNKLNIAGIGVGGRGASDIDGVSSENIVGLSTNIRMRRNTRIFARC